MWEKVGPREGEEEDIEQAEGKVDGVDETYNGKGNGVMCEGSVTHY